MENVVLNDFSINTSVTPEKLCLFSNSRFETSSYFPRDNLEREINSLISDYNFLTLKYSNITNITRK